MRIVLIMLICLISKSAAAEPPMFANKYDAGAYKIAWHYAFSDSLKSHCKNLKSEGNLGHLGPFPKHYSDYDKRFKTMEQATSRGNKEGGAARDKFIKAQGERTYCKRLMLNYGSTGKVSNNYVVSKNMEELAGLRDRDLKGCKNVSSLVSFGWSCDLDPAAMPQTCEAIKKVQIKKGECRLGLRVLQHQLSPTGKTHKDIWHKEHTGMKNSGPFLEVKSKDGGIWWVDKFSWNYATEK